VQSCEAGAEPRTEPRAEAGTEAGTEARTTEPAPPTTRAEPRRERRVEAGIGLTLHVLVVVALVMAALGGTPGIAEAERFVDIEAGPRTARTTPPARLGEGIAHDSLLSVDTLSMH
jgi:hypothetical protein